jgi:hypothetical protein
MAKGKDGGDNNYTPIKNPELLGGQPDKRTPEQMVSDNKKPEAKKDNESFVDLARRTTQKQSVAISPEVEEKGKQPDNSKDLGKDQQKQTPRKDINNEPEKDR